MHKPTLFFIAAVLALAGAEASAAHERERDRRDRHERTRDGSDRDRDCPPADEACDALGSHGAIFTTDEDGSLVDGNVYQRSTDVYLNGGVPSAKTGHCHRKDQKDHAGRPGHPRHDRRDRPGSRYDDRDDDRDKVRASLTSGLPNGEYYFQVTNPSGSRLLSTRPLVERRVDVVDGYIQGGSTTHRVVVLGNPFPVGYSIVQLAPFRPTDSPGREYKVWLTPIAAYRAGEGKFGFIPSCSKTDTFKVRSAASTSTLSGFVFQDLNLNGTWENAAAGPPPGPAVSASLEEPVLAAVPVALYAPGGSTPIASGFSSSLGVWGIELSPESFPATYEVRSVAASWFAPTRSSVVVTLTAPGESLSHVDLGVALIGGPISNIGTSPAYFSGGPGEAVTRNVLWPDDSLPPPDPLGAGIVQQAACPGAGPFASLQHVSAFLTLNAESADPLCALAANWLSLEMAIASNGGNVAADGVYVLDPYTVQSITGDETVYLGFDPLTGEPVFMRLGDLLSFLASDFGALTPEYQSFYAAALQHAANGQTFVQSVPPGGTP